MHILQQLNQIESCTGKNKVGLIKHFDSPELRRVFELAYSPFIRFGISLGRASQLLTPADTEAPTYEEMFALLDSLAQREFTGEAAEKEIVRVMNTASWDTQMLFIRILDKHLRIGCGAKTINKAIPGCVPVFEVQAAELFAPGKAVFPCAASAKLDGMRLLAIRRQGVLFFKTRAGHDVPSLKHLLPELDALLNEIEPTGDVILDAEVTCEGGFNATMSALRSHEPTTKARVWLFDFITCNSVDDLLSGAEVSQPYKKRYPLLSALGNLLLTSANRSGSFSVLHHIEVGDYEELMQLYEGFTRNGLEGAMAKTFDGLWEPRRSSAWMKLKGVDTYDGFISGFIAGTGKNKGMLGAIVMDFNGEDVRVGTGFSDEERQQIWSNREKYIGKTIEVQAQCVTSAGSLRHPRFIRMRPDKSLT